ncbi:MAG: helix-turn-helix transcriptional regulator [Clostridiales bacterium]|nr:helix-turn-helix transcriptional regulator [Clostridiales bacterium]
MNNAQLATTIKTLCKQNNISISKLLNECNIRKSFIYDLEKRDYTPSAQAVETIADYLNCSVDYLLGRTNNPEINH